MLYTCRELINKLGSFSKVTLAVKRGEYFKLSHGVYCDESPNIHEVESLFLKYPNAILTLESAFAYYDLSDYIPEKYVLATPHNAHIIKDKKVEQIFMTNDILGIGKIKVSNQFGTINIYDKERLLIEVIRFRNRISYSLFKEVINSYRELVKNEELDLTKLLDYLRKIKRGKTIQKHIQEIVM